MNLYLFLSATEDVTITHFDSLMNALQYCQEDIVIFSEYDLPEFGLDHVSVKHVSRDEIIVLLKENNNDAFVAHSSTIFTAETFPIAMNAHAYYTKNNGPAMIQLIFPNALLETPKPALLLYGGGRMWLSGTRLFTNETTIPVAYGNTSIIASCILKEKTAPAFSDGIFCGGSTNLLTAIPPLAFNVQFEPTVKIASDSFDMNTYISEIPQFFITTDEK